MNTVYRFLILLLYFSSSFFLVLGLGDYGASLISIWLCIQKHRDLGLGRCMACLKNNVFPFQ
jgi:hypothetical protein